ncbi:MAG TPA: hypothetical protein VE985_09945 [Gaiellaceae bacterium]|nr:hypothetical protein [Gaiellaceae bacterium]
MPSSIPACSCRATRSPSSTSSSGSTASAEIQKRSFSTNVSSGIR